MIPSAGAPVEPATGQDGPPDVATAIRAVIRVFREILDNSPGRALGASELNRIAALHRALERLRDHLERENT